MLIVLHNSVESSIDQSIAMTSLGAPHADHPDSAADMERRLLATPDPLQPSGGPHSLRRRHSAAGQSDDLRDDDEMADTMGSHEREYSSHDDASADVETRS